MNLPNKITNVLSKISKYYIVEYNDGKISSVSISDKDINIEMSSKGYCISIEYHKEGECYIISEKL